MPGNALGRKWWWPIRLGLPLAIVAWAILDAALLPQIKFYASFHLFKTALSIALLRVDMAVALSVGVLYFIITLYSVAGCLHGKPRKLARLAIGAGTAALALFACWYAHWNLFLLKPFSQFVVLLQNDRYLSFHLPGVIGGIVLLLIIVVRLTPMLKRCAFALQAPLRLCGIIVVQVLNLASLLLILVLVSSHLAFGYYSSRNAISRKTRPNVIIIMVDTLRADHVGCYGYLKNSTPNIDRFARGATLFSKAISQAPWTPWSVYSFMSSRYPDSYLLGMPLQSTYPWRGPMLAEILRDQGYSTEAVVSNTVLDIFPETRSGFDRFDMSTSDKMKEVTSPDVTALALKRLAVLKDRRFFLYLVYIDPHDPYIAHKGYNFRENASSPRPQKISLARDSGEPRPARCAVASAQMARYDSEIAFTDAHVGRVIDALKQKGLYDDALVIFLSDHGEEFQEHGRVGHIVTLYDELLNVPLMIKFPGQQQGTVVRGTFPLLDLNPSVLGLLRANNPAYRQLGKDDGIAHLQRCQEQPIFSSTINGLYSVRSSQEKYIVHARGSRQELYRLTGDRWEQHNLAGTQPAESARWQGLLAARPGQNMQGTPFSARQQSAPPSLTQKQLDQLRSLGYLQ